MKSDLIHFLSTDQLRLPGLLYDPGKTTKVALYLHGNGTSSVFYSPLMNLLGERLSEKNIAFFPFNNRGAHLIKSLKRINESGEEERVMGGTAYELIKDCIYDIDGAIEELNKRGFDTFYLVGESTGANKIVVYHYYKKDNPVAKYILLSGGDDTGITYKELGNNLFIKALKKAKQQIEKGNGERLVPRYLSALPYSYQSFYDVINPDGDYNIFPYIEYANKLHLSKKNLFREFATIDKPALIVYGEFDEYCYGKTRENVEILTKHTSDPSIFTFNIIPGADHGFSDHREEVSRVITSWL